MLYSLALLVLMDPSIGVQPSQVDALKASVPFNSYTQAYHEAQRSKKPLILILNSGDAKQPPVQFVDLQKTKQRRELLDSYVVAVIDVSTEHGKTVHGLFENQPLPHVAVTDREQKRQVFRTSRKLQGEDWNLILTRFQKGESTAKLNLDFPDCPFCK